MHAFSHHQAVAIYFLSSRARSWLNFNIYYHIAHCALGDRHLSVDCCFCKNPTKCVVQVGIGHHLVKIQLCFLP